MRSPALTFVACLCAASAVLAQPRMTTDFELSAIQKTIQRERDPIRLSVAYLNLGDIRNARSESEPSIEAYRSALSIASKERTASRSRSDLATYALATAYAGLAQAKLGQAADAFASFEESTRYTAHSPRIWNLYSSAMSLTGQYRKASSVARNAVAIASRQPDAARTTSDRLELDVYRYALASALANEAGPAGDDEAIEILEQVVGSLSSAAFSGLKTEVSRSEAFEIYSSVGGDVNTYVSLLGRSRLRLARLYEARRQNDRARQLYHDVLAVRSDDAAALTALARLTSETSEKSRYFSEAFDANPFSPPLIREYEVFLSAGGRAPSTTSSTGGAVRSVVEALISAQPRRAADALELLIKQFPQSEALLYLSARADLDANRPAAARATAARPRDLEWRGDILRRTEAGQALGEGPPAFLKSGGKVVTDPAEADLKLLSELLIRDRLAAGDRKRLDDLTLSSLVVFSLPITAGAGTTTFRAGSIGALRFQFSSPTTFTGSYRANEPLRLDYRILGASQHEEGRELLLEAVRVTRP